MEKRETYLLLDTKEERLVEALAAYAHEAWAGWMNYLFGKCERADCASSFLVIPEWAVLRWKRQAETKYADLPEQEKESDRKEAREMLRIIREHL